MWWGDGCFYVCKNRLKLEELYQWGGKTEKNRPRQMTYYCFNRSVPSWSVDFSVCVVNAGNGKLFHFLSLCPSGSL